MQQTPTGTTTATNGSEVILQPAPRATTRHRNPTQLDKPSFLVNFPFSLATDAPNNAWMQDLEDRSIDLAKAAKQFSDLYHNLASEALVYVLPTPPDCRLQDLVYVANLAIVLEHLPGKDTVVVSNFSSAPRRGEAPLGVKFFESMGYRAVVAPDRFEGEAELKHLHGNVYVGGYGERSAKATYDWMEREFDMKVVKVELTDPYLYHLDTLVFPVTPEDTLVCTEGFTDAEVKALEQHTNLIPVTLEECYSGICNSVRLFNTVMNSSHLHELKKGTDEYAEEVAKNRKLEDVATDLGFEVNYVNLSEYHKSGALLSCMVMHLNRNSYRFTLI